MTTKQYLSQIIVLEQKIKLLNAEIYHRRQLAQSLSAVSIDEINIQHSGKNDVIGEKICEILSREEDLKRLIESYSKARDVIESEIGQMQNPLYYNVLYGKYIAGLTLFQIGEFIGRKPRQMVNIHNRALNGFEKIFGEKYKNSKLH